MINNIKKYDGHGIFCLFITILNDKKILKNSGSVSHLEMEKKVREQLEKFNKQKLLKKGKVMKLQFDSNQQYQIDAINIMKWKRR